MKKLTILLFSILISFNSYGEWVEVSTAVNGATYHVNTDTIKKNNGYTYYWELNDFITPLSGKYMSGKAYNKGDCGVNRFQLLLLNLYKQPMGKGDNKEIRGDDKWQYPEPGTVRNSLLNYVCNYVK